MIFDTIGGGCWRQNKLGATKRQGQSDTQRQAFYFDFGVPACPLICTKEFTLFRVQNSYERIQIIFEKIIKTLKSKYRVVLRMIEGSKEREVLQMHIQRNKYKILGTLKLQDLTK